MTIPQSQDVRLIERWLPIAALGEESVRERTPMTPFPAPNRLHVWWARRPLVTCRAAILASLLPADADRDRFMHAIGIHGDPVESRKRIEKARITGTRFKGPAYPYTRAFKYSPNADERSWLLESIGSDNPLVLDPTAGGGSIPFESIRLGLDSQCNDLNPVAALIMRATVDWPSSLDPEILLEAYEELAARFSAERERRLESNYPLEPQPTNYSTNWLWARTIKCPYCDGLVPLSPNWRLASNGTGIRINPDLQAGPGSPGRVCTFEIVRSAGEQSEGTIARGEATCPYDDCGRVIGGDYVKEISQAGEMGEQLYAVVFKRPVETMTKTGKKRVKWVRDFRTPRAEDDIPAEIESKLGEKLSEWEALDCIPVEPYNEMFSDRLRNYGVRYWRDLFSPRQLLCHGTNVEIYRELLEEDQSSGQLDEFQRAAYGYLAITLDKLIDYNSRKCIWISQREVVGHTFTKHDYSFAWSYVEMSPLLTGAGYDWVINQVAKCIKELTELIQPVEDVFSNPSLPINSRNSVHISCKPGDRLDQIRSGSVDAVVMDPPYYDNVMYAELSDFFYVWLKRTAGYVFPELFRRTLTDKDNEAVANPLRFKGEKSVKDLAVRDYQERMGSIFTECRRVLKDNGLMTLMFNHKATGAWDALTSGLIKSGFTITASWPVNTEAPGSLHIKDKAAAKSTILLVCRPRVADSAGQTDPEYWEEVEYQVEAKVRSRIAEFQESGIRGVDLFLASFGPALEVFSRHWPLTRGTPRPKPTQQQLKIRDVLGEDSWDPYEVTPEDALVAARREVKRWRLEQIAPTADTDLDPITAFFVFAWDTFKAPVFPFDEALQLARSIGVDLESDIVGRLATKKGQNLTLLDSSTRAAKGFLGPITGSRGLIDSLHHAANIAQTHSVTAATEVLEEHDLLQQPEFETARQAVLEVLPISSRFTKIELKGNLAAASNDFDALYSLSRLAKGREFREPKQLDLWQKEIEA